MSDYDAMMAWRGLCERYNELQLEVLVKEGYAMPDGLFPIVDKVDLDRAFLAWGMYAEKRIAARRHICRRAGEMMYPTPLGFCGP